MYYLVGTLYFSKQFIICHMTSEYTHYITEDFFAIERGKISGNLYNKICFEGL